MKQIILPLALTLALTACGKNPDRPQVVQPQFAATNSEFSAYVDLFVQEAKITTGVDYSKKIVPINFTELTYSENGIGTVGTCRYYTSGKREILIDPNFWASASEARRAALIFHELGHCVLNRLHNDTVDSRGPVSIMHTYLLDADIFEDHYGSYVTELFTRTVTTAADEKFIAVKRTQSKAVMNEYGHIGCNHE